MKSVIIVIVLHNFGRRENIDLTYIIVGAHTTPRLSSFCDDSIISLIETRGSELDLLAPEVIHLFFFTFHFVFLNLSAFFIFLLIFCRFV